MTHGNSFAKVRSIVSPASTDVSEMCGKNSYEPELTIAVIGSGPSGCYAAAFLAKALPRSVITIFESLPTPYGLVRYGIAADHQGTKNVTRQFDRLFTRDGVRFAGNVSVGEDIDFVKLASCFDVVVLATGLPHDRPLDIPQEDGTQVIGAGALLRAFNGYPMEVIPRNSDGRYAALGRNLAVVGMGNVAIDVVRLLSKDPQDLHGSDINDELFEQLRPTRPSNIHVISRSTVSQAKFDLAMMRELLSLPNIDVTVTGLDDRDNGPAADLLRPFTETDATSIPSMNPRTNVRLHFQLVPDAIASADDHMILRASRQSRINNMIEIAVDSVVTAIGFTNGSPNNQCCPNADWSGANVYRVGWLNRGAQGAIPENRKDARRVVDNIVADVASGRLSAGRPGFAAAEVLLRDVVTFTDWQQIEAFEQKSAPPDRCRRKVTDRERMLRIASTSVITDPTHRENAIRGEFQAELQS